MNKATNIYLGKIETFFLTVFKQTNDPSILKAGPNHPDYWVKVGNAKVRVTSYSEDVLLDLLRRFVSLIVDQARNGQSITIQKTSFSNETYRVCLSASASVFDPHSTNECYKCHAEATLP